MCILKLAWLWKILLGIVKYVVSIIVGFSIFFGAIRLEDWIRAQLKKRKEKKNENNSTTIR